MYKALQEAHKVLNKYYTKVNPETGTNALLATMLDPYQRLTHFKKWDKELGQDYEQNKDSYSQQYRNLFLSYFEEHYLDPVDNGPPPSAETANSTPRSTIRSKGWKGTLQRNKAPYPRN